MPRNVSPEHPSAPAAGSRFDRGCAAFRQAFGLSAETLLDVPASVTSIEPRT
jgi:hypothetical protein